jgi:hypothetical protein
MIALVKDLDDPFDYDGKGKAGAAEVSLWPLDYLERRMRTEYEELSREAPPGSH